jgi:hypothetical protein
MPELLAALDAFLQSIAAAASWTAVSTARGC